MAKLTGWRLVKRRHAEAAFDGEGARMFGGRWNSAGVRVVYASSSLALAALEVLAGIEKTALLAFYSVVSVRFAAHQVESLSPSSLPDHWRRHPPTAATQTIGDRWVAEGRSLVLQVPSALIESESNFLLNPAHPDYAALERSGPAPFEFDPRLVAALRKH